MKNTINSFKFFMLAAITTTFFTLNACKKDDKKATTCTAPDVPVISNDSPHKNGESLALKVENPASGVTYTWTAPNGEQKSGESVSYTFSASMDGKAFTCVASKGGCSSEPAYTYTIDCGTAPTISGDTIISDGGTLKLSVPRITFATYKWTTPAIAAPHADSVVATTNELSIPNFKTVHSGIYSVTITKSGCTTPAGTRHIQVKPSATIAVTHNTVNDSMIFTVTPKSAIPGATYSWSLPDDTAKVNTTNKYFTRSHVTRKMVGVYTLYITYKGLVSDPIKINVGIKFAYTPCTGNDTLVKWNKFFYSHARYFPAAKQCWIYTNLKSTANAKDSTADSSATGFDFASFLSPDRVPLKGICPDGYHTPSDSEWNVLLNNVSVQQLNAAGFLPISNFTGSTSDYWTNTPAFGDLVWYRRFTVDVPSSQYLYLRDAGDQKTKRFVKCLRD